MIYPSSPLLSVLLCRKRLGVGAAALLLLLLLAGTPVTAPPRLNLALLDFSNGAYQAYQCAIERLAQATVEWQTLRQGNGQPEAIQAAAAAQAARHKEVTDADKIYKAAAKKARGKATVRIGGP